MVAELRAPAAPFVVPALPLNAALTAGCIGVDMNDDHLAAWQLDTHGNPVGEPHRFFYALTGTAAHRDAQIRHALTRLLRWGRRCGVKAIAARSRRGARAASRSITSSSQRRTVEAETPSPPAMSKRRWSCRITAGTMTAILPGGSLRQRDPIALRRPRIRSATVRIMALDSGSRTW